MRLFTQYDDLPGTGISHIVLDDDGVLWFPNNNGLGSYNYKKNIFSLYNELDGFIDANKSPSTKLKMKDGTFWFIFHFTNAKICFI